MHKKDLVYVADFETTSKNQYLKEGRSRVYLYEMKSIDNKEKYIGLSIEEYFNTLENIVNKSKMNLTCFFHNGSSFDFYFILYYIMEKRYIQVMNEKELVNNSFIVLITDMKKIYNLKIKINEFTISFKCSYLILPCSIKELGKDFGLNKLDETHNYKEFKNYKSIEEIPTEELMYIENDVEILRNAIQFALSNGLTKMTIASSSFNLWKQSNYLDYKTLYEIKDEEMLTYISRSYKGGITQVNKRFKGQIIDEEFISLDVNSLYPYTMRNNSMPFGKPKFFNTLEEYKDSNYKKAIIHIYVTKAQIIEGFIPFIPTKSLSRLGLSYEYSETIEDLDLYLWEEKYELFKLYYTGQYDIVRVLAFKEIKGFFDSYLDLLFKAKESAPNDFLRRIAKLKMNSIYGKFATSILQIKCIPYLENGLIKFNTDEEEGLYYSKEIASYITSQASNQWIKLVNSNPERFIYGDTDSAYLIGTEIPKGIEVDQKKIGAWKLEHIYSKGKFLKAKCYIKTIKGEDKIIVTVSGMPKECHNLITYDNFEVGFKLEGVKHIAKRVEGGVIIEDTDFTIKT